MQNLLQLLCCPRCAGKLRALYSGGSDTGGDLECTGCAQSFPVVSGIPRFVPADNYADNFGLQWNRFSRTQLDSASGLSITRDRFYRTSGWSEQQLRDKLVLDLGCGSGRFAEIALAAGARVIAVDYSRAVDACWENLGDSDRIAIVQADVYALPFPAAQFDYIYCFGVLQHTPDPRNAFLALPRLLTPDGHIAVDVYPRVPLNWLWPKYWLRPITRRMAPAQLFAVLQRVVPRLLPVSRALGRIPVVGRKLRYAVPVLDYYGVFPLTETQLAEWALLDTFDMLAPAHDHPQDTTALAAWCAEAGLRDVSVQRPGLVVARGKR